MTSVLLLALAPTFFVMLLGYTAGRAGIVNNMHVAELNTVVMAYALPASLFVATTSTSRSALIAQWPILVSLALVMMGTYLLWYWYERKIRQQDASEAALQALAVGQPNFSAAGLPVITALFGNEHASTVAVGSLFPSPLTLAILELSQSKPGASRGPVACVASAAGHAMSKPIVLAPIFGTFVSLAGLSLPAVVLASLQEIGAAAGGLALFVTGLVLSERPFHLSRNTLLGTALANIAQPLITFAICRALDASVMTTKLSVVMAALPSGFFGILFGTSYRRPTRPIPRSSPARSFPQLRWRERSLGPTATPVVPLRSTPKPHPIGR
jgi:malonate transporter